MNLRLTSDNTLLSRPTNDLSDTATFCAIDCTSRLPDDVAGYVRDSLSENSRRAYRSDLTHFEAWGGTIPSTDRQIAAYLAAHAETLTVATLVRRLTGIAKAHVAKGFPNPATAELVKAAKRGIKRSRGVARRQAKPLLRDDLFQLLAVTDDSLRDIRDRALLLVGFAGGFRRSEIVGLDRGDVEEVRQGLVVTLRRSKTDQFGAGRTIGIPFGRSRRCPIAALDQWLAGSAIETGPIFRPVNRHGHVGTGRLSGEAVSLVVKERVSVAGFDPAGYSGHSLRAGFVTSAAQAGVSSWRIRQQTGHASEAMLARYIRSGEMFIDNATGALL